MSAASGSRPSLFGATGAAKQRLLDRLRNYNEVQALRRAVGVPDLEETTGAGRRYRRIEALPGFETLAFQKHAAEALEIANPFFRAHDGIAGASTRIDGREVTNFASYNYLDLCGHPAVSAAAKAAIDRFGTSVSASRLVSGERPPQRELEQALAALLGTEDCVTFVSGHATNVTVIGHIVGAGDLILHDALAHNSVVLGAGLSGAARRTFPHNDWRALETLLKGRRDSVRRVLVIVEGLYSMDGDTADLPHFVDICRRYDAFLMVDEAHSIGVLGATGGGLRAHFGLAANDADLWMGTLSKSFAACGGYIAGQAALVEYLKFTAPGFVYSVGLMPAAAAAATAAIRVMQAEPGRIARLHDRTARFLARARERGLNTGLSQGYAIVPVIIGSSIRAVRLSNALLARGINVQPILHPAVEERNARLRLFFSCAHTDEQIDTTADIIAEELARTGRDR